MKHSFFRIPVLFINFADDNRNGSHVSLFTLLMEREFFNYPNRFILQCDNGEWWGLHIVSGANQINYILVAFNAYSTK